MEEEEEEGERGGGGQVEGTGAGLKEERNLLHIDEAFTALVESSGPAAKMPAQGNARSSSRGFDPHIQQQHGRKLLAIEEGGGVEAASRGGPQREVLDLNVHMLNVEDAPCDIYSPCLMLHALRSSWTASGASGLPSSLSSKAAAASAASTARRARCAGGCGGSCATWMH